MAGPGNMYAGLYQASSMTDTYDYSGGYQNVNNQTPGSYFVDPNRTGDSAAQDTLADLYEAEFQDYLNRFFPVEKDLIQQMTTGFDGLQQEEIGRAQEATARQYANVQGQQSRRMAGYGLQQDSGYAQDASRGETGAMVAAKNFARLRSEERRQQILSGGTGSALTQKSVISG
jgi:hypothetical protein